jgi:uncharacterized SAM-dependent methyltransferase
MPNRQDEPDSKDFLESTVQLFSRQVQGHMGFFIRDARSTDTLDQMLNQQRMYGGSYYPFDEEQALTTQVIEYVQSLGLNKPTVIDVRPRTFTTCVFQTARVVQALNPQRYIAIDRTKAFLRNAQQVLTPLFPNIPIKPVIDAFPLQRSRRLHGLSPTSTPLTFMWGCQMDEQTSKFGIFPTWDMERDLAAVQTLTKGLESYFIVTQDATPAREAILQSYNNPLHAKLYLNLLHKIQRRLAPRIKPRAFDYDARWSKENYRVDHMLVSTENQSFELGGWEIRLSQGDSFRVHSTFKLPAARFLDMPRKRDGFEHQKTITSPRGRLHAHVFKLLP